MDDLTPLQELYVDAIETALTVGSVTAVLVVFLLSIIAVRGLSSWK